MKMKMKMKMKKIIMFIFLLMISLVGVNATFDTNTTGTYINNGADLSSGKYVTFDRVNGLNLIMDQVTSSTKSIEFDINFSDMPTFSYLFDSLEQSDRFSLSLKDGTLQVFDSSYHNSGITFSLGVWKHIKVSTIGTNLEIYVDNSLIPSYTTTVDNTVLEKEPWFGTHNSGTNSQGLNGSIRNLIITSNGIIKFKHFFPIVNETIPTLTFTNISANNITLINNTFYNSSIDFETTVLNTSTNGLVNHTYSLNGGAFIQYATNNLFGSVNLNLSEGYYNISFCAENNETNICSNNYSFLVDMTKPNIQVLQPLTTDSYFINFSNAINVTDNLSGLKNCTINITYLEANESDSNFLIGCTDTQLFTRAGLYNGFVTAEDNAGNINTLDANGTINPIINIFFTETNSSIIFNYTPTIFHPDGRITFPEIQPDGNIQLSPVNDGEVDFGIHTIKFEKIGFITQNFTQVVNSTNAGINVTFNASASIINLIIRDKKTSSIISGPIFDVDFIATVGLSTNTSTGNLTISNIFFLSEDYRVDISNSLYKTESIFFTFTNQEELNIVSYMSLKTDSTIGFVTIKVSDRFGNPLSGVKVEALQWDSITSTYIPVSQQNTDEKGLGVLNIILDSELYKFRATLNNLQIESVDQRITDSENGKEIPLRLSALTSEENYILENVLTVVTEDFNESTNISIITFDWEDLTGISQTVCINAFRIINGAEIKLTNDTSQCVQGVSGTLIRAFYINSSYTTNLQAQVKLEEDYIKVKSFPHYSEFSISNIIDNLKLTQFATPVLFILAITLGFATNIYLGVIGLALASIGSIWITPTVLNGSVVVFFLFVSVVTLSGGKKP